MNFLKHKDKNIETGDKSEKNQNHGSNLKTMNTRKRAEKMTSTIKKKKTQEKNNRLERYQFLVFTKVSENRP